MVGDEVTLEICIMHEKLCFCFFIIYGNSEHILKFIKRSDIIVALWSVRQIIPRYAPRDLNQPRSPSVPLLNP